MNRKKKPRTMNYELFRAFVPLCLCACILFALITNVYSQDLNVQASVSANEVAVGEQITYSISLSGSVGSLPQPQLPDLSNFKVYNAGTSQSFQFVNGQVSSSVTYNYTLVPIQEGEFTIGPALVSHNGKNYQTQSITIKVVKQKTQTPPAQQQAPSSTEERYFGQNETGELFIKSIVNKDRVYVNEPIIYSYKIYFRNVSIGQYGISKFPDFSGFWVEDVPPERTKRQNVETFNGKRYYTVILENKILFPASPGKKYIDESRFNFVIEDFFSLFGKRVDRESNPITVTVVPLPDNGKPVHFKGSVGNYQLTYQLSSKNFIQNEPFSLKITVAGNGNIKSISEPTIPELKNFRIYDTHASVNIQKNANGVSGNKTFEYILIPELAGKLEIPAFSFSYFNYVTDKYQTLTTKPLVLNVKPGKPGSENLYTSKYQPSQSDVKLIGKDIQFIKENIVRIKNQADYFYHYKILWLLIILPLIVLISSFYSHQYRLKLETDITFAKASRAYKFAKKRLIEIEKQIDKKNYKEINSLFEKAITGYISDKFNVPISNIVMDQIKKILVSKKLTNKEIELIEELYNEVNMLKYSPSQGNNSNYRSLLKQCNELLTNIEKKVRI